MVFRGRLSKACQRCRDRRLRVGQLSIRHQPALLPSDFHQCDFQRPSCGSCIRASTPCIGYRDTVTIRIADETNDVRTKAGARGDVLPAIHSPSASTDIEVFARNVFFTNYVNELEQTWGVLLKYHGSVGIPEHLTLSLDAVSLAFMAHHTQSIEAKELGRKKYVSALRVFNKELQDPDSGKRVSTFEGALLLDLFEQLAILTTENTTPRHAHVDGALALAKLRGIDTFQEGCELSLLLGLSLNATVCCLTNKREISEPIRLIRAHAARYVNVADLNWKLSGALMDFVDLSSDLYASAMTEEEKATRCVKLEGSLEAMSREAIPNWSYESFEIPAEQREGYLPNDSQLCHRYPNRAVMQTWNILRLLRILLYEELASFYPSPPWSSRISELSSGVTAIIQEICASVPYTIDCSFAASNNLPLSTDSRIPQPCCQESSHTIPHTRDAYVLVLPLYVAAWSQCCSPPTRLWILNQLERIAMHFGNTEANIVRDLLLNEVDTDSALSSW